MNTARIFTYEHVDLFYFGYHVRLRTQLPGLRVKCKQDTYEVSPGNGRFPLLKPVAPGFLLREDSCSKGELLPDYNHSKRVRPQGA